MLLLLHHLTSEHAHLDLAERTLLVFADEYTKYDYMAASYGLSVLHSVNHPTEVAVVGETSATQPLLAAAHDTYSPWRIVLPLDPTRDSKIIETRGFPAQNTPVAYVCRDQVCSAPVTTASDLIHLLDR